MHTLGSQGALGPASAVGGARVRALLLAAVAVCVACAPRDAGIRRERLAAEHRVLQAALDDLQIRLLADQARVRFWQEMRERHESVAALACSVQEEHAREMAERLLPDEEVDRLARASSQRLRVADVRTAGLEARRSPAAERKKR